MADEEFHNFTELSPEQIRELPEAVRIHAAGAIASCEVVQLTRYYGLGPTAAVQVLAMAIALLAQALDAAAADKSDEQQGVIDKEVERILKSEKKDEP